MSKYYTHDNNCNYTDERFLKLSMKIKTQCCNASSCILQRASKAFQEDRYLACAVRINIIFTVVDDRSGDSTIGRKIRVEDAEA